MDAHFSVERHAIYFWEWLTNEKWFSLLSTALPYLSLSLSSTPCTVCLRFLLNFFFSHSHFCFVSGQYLFFYPRSIRNGNKISFGQTISITRRFAFIQVRSHSHANCKVYHIFKSFKLPNTVCRQKFMNVKTKTKKCIQFFDEMDRIKKMCFLVFAAHDTGELENIAFAIGKEMLLLTQSQLCIEHK